MFIVSNVVPVTCINMEKHR